MGHKGQAMAKSVLSGVLIHASNNQTLESHSGVRLTEDNGRTALGELLSVETVVGMESQRWRASQLVKAVTSRVCDLLGP